MHSAARATQPTPADRRRLKDAAERLFCKPPVRSEAHKALDHALGDMAMGQYRMGPEQLAQAKAHAGGTYALQIEILEGHDSSKQAVLLAARMVLEAAGYRPVPIDAPLNRVQVNQKQEAGHTGGGGEA